MHCGARGVCGMAQVSLADGLTSMSPCLDSWSPLSQAVAVGAAIQAAMLEGQLDDFMVMDVWQVNCQSSLACGFVDTLSYMCKWEPLRQANKRMLPWACRRH